MTNGSSSAKRPARLGRGLSSLVGGGGAVRVETTPPETSVHNTNEDTPVSGTELVEAPVESIRPNPHQPRRTFDDAALAELAASIQADGVMQPVVVGRVENWYELVAGERRLRASKRAGLTHIPAIVRAVDDQTSAELALIENLQRADLNPVERAGAFKALIDRHGLTQARLGMRLGIDRAVIANHLRLLELGDAFLEMLGDGCLNYAQARALAGVEDEAARLALAERVIEEGWSARAIERHLSGAEDAGQDSPSSDITNDVIPPAEQGSSLANTTQTRARAVLDDMEKRLSEHLGTRVALKTDRGGQKGTLTISFFSLDEFDGLLDRLGFRGTGV